MQVLSDAQKREIYDKYGEEGLKGGFVPPGAQGNPFEHGGGPGGGSFKFNPRSADDIFAEFFGGASPFGGGGFHSFQSVDGSGMGGGGPRIRVQRMGGDGMGGFGMFGGDAGHSFSSRPSPPPSPPSKPATIENKLMCSLEELYTGSTRKMKISRQIADASG